VLEVESGVLQVKDEAAVHSEAKVETVACSKAGDDAAACSKVGDDAVACSGAGIEDGIWQRHCDV
jgi:hypothetical protein